MIPQYDIPDIPEGWKSYKWNIKKNPTVILEPSDPLKHEVFQARDVIFEEGVPRRTVPITTSEGENPANVKSDGGDGDEISVELSVGRNGGDGDENSVEEESEQLTGYEKEGEEGKDIPTLRRSSRKVKPSYKISESASTATSNTPQSYSQAIRSIDHVHWQNAMLYEYDKIMEHNVAIEVDRPDTINVIKGRWVYNKKHSANSEVEY